MAHEEGTGNIDGGHLEEELVKFEFPFGETAGATLMKIIPPSALSNFRGVSS